MSAEQETAEARQTLREQPCCRLADFWHGRVCLSRDLTPHVDTVDGDPTIAYAMAYLSSGVAMATYCGGLVTDLVAGKDVPRDTPLTGAGLPIAG